MFDTLPQFYNSGEWKAFRSITINDRINSVDGVIYCEQCKKAIINKYDLVLHHIRPLTMQNVNDYSISLNPANIKIVCQSCHNEIHKRFGYVTERKVFYVYGSPCSGKTTFVNKVKGNSDIVYDMDSIWECITGVRYEKPKALKTIAFGLRDSLLDMIRTRAGNWEKAYIIETGAVSSERSRKIELYGAEPIFIDTPKEICLKRLYDGCNRPQAVIKEYEGYINKWFDDYTE